MSIDRISALRESGEEVMWDFGKLPAQLDYLNSDAPYTMFSGGFACGKTTVLVAKIIGLLLGVPGNMGYLGRLDGKALRSTTLQVLYEMLPEHYYTKNEQQGFLKIKKEFGGSKLLFGDFKDLNDLKNIPLGFFAIDQAEEIPWEVWEYLVGRNRRKVPILTQDGIRQYRVVGECPALYAVEVTDKRHVALHHEDRCMRCGERLISFDEKLPPKAKNDQTPRLRPWDLIVYPNFGFGVCNPEGPSHWIYQKFDGLPGHDGKVSSGGLPGYRAWHATAYEGLEAGFTREDYLQGMEVAYAGNPLMQERYLYGVWVEAEGLVYPAFKQETHILPRRVQRYDETQLIDPKWPIAEWIDHGLTAPTAVGFCAIEDTCSCGCGKTNYYLIDEHYQGGRTVSYHAQLIKAKRENHAGEAGVTYLDSQAFAKTQSGQKGTPKENELFSIADEYVENGIYCVPNQKDWDSGYNRIGEVLAIDKNHIHPITGEKGAPHFFVLNNCKHFIDEITKYRWKKVRTGMAFKEEPQDDNDHHMDGLNGFLTSRPGTKVNLVDDARIETESWLSAELSKDERTTETHMSL